MLELNQNEANLLIQIGFMMQAQNTYAVQTSYLANMPILKQEPDPENFFNSNLQEVLRYIDYYSNSLGPGDRDNDWPDTVIGLSYKINKFLGNG